MTPIGKYIVIKNINEEIKTDSGLILSAEDAKSMRYQKGIVVAPGTDVSVIKANDTIYYDKSYAFTMVINDTPQTIIREMDVVVVLDNHSS